MGFRGPVGWRVALSLSSKRFGIVFRIRVWVLVPRTGASLNTWKDRPILIVSYSYDRSKSVVLFIADLQISTQIAHLPIP